MWVRVHYIFLWLVSNNLYFILGKNYIFKLVSKSSLYIYTYQYIYILDKKYNVQIHILKSCHHRLWAGTWQPLQSMSSHFVQHFLKKPQPSRSQRYFVQCVTCLVHCFHWCLSPHGVLKSWGFPFFPCQDRSLPPFPLAFCFDVRSSTFVSFEAGFSDSLSICFGLPAPSTAASIVPKRCGVSWNRLLYPLLLEAFLEWFDVQHLPP